MMVYIVVGERRYRQHSVVKAFSCKEQAREFEESLYKEMDADDKYVISNYTRRMEK